MAGIGRLRVSRRRQGPNWMRLSVIAVLAAVGGTVLWNGLQYSVAHSHSFGVTRRVAQQSGADGQLDQEGGDPNTDASLSAWTQLTELPGTAGSAGSSGSSSESDSKQQKGGGNAAAVEEGKKFMTVQLRVLKMPPTYNSWVQTEDMLLFHQRALQQQLEQTYVAMALAAAAGRAFVLPEFSCFCQNSAAPLPRCRRPDSESLQFPAACRDGEVLVPPPEFKEAPGERGMALDVRPATFLQDLEAAGGQESELVLRPSAQILFPKCKDAKPNPDPKVISLETCVHPTTREGEEGRAVMLVPPSLNDTDLLPLLEPLQKYRLWRLDLSDVGSHWHAFAGWDCEDPAHQFDKRMSRVVKPWPKPAAASGDGAGGSAPLLEMKMTAGRTYSDEPDMKKCTGSGGAASNAAAAAR